MRRLSGVLLVQAMRLRGWSNEDLARELKVHGYDVDPKRIVNKWCSGKLQPSMERIQLIERTLGYEVSEAPKPRRTFFGNSSASSIAA
jgi:ribosome-binding protein aMBF1 (putative translation factor)